MFPLALDSLALGSILSVLEVLLIVLLLVAQDDNKRHITMAEYVIIFLHI